MAAERQMTELEGAILTEIAMRGNDTAYQVRRAFQDSPSVQWRGSAGAVSPAIQRLTASGLIAATAHPSRKGLKLTLTDRGELALFEWATDAELACGVGLDPFRLRSGLWERLPPAKRNRLYERLQTTLERELAALDRRDRGDAVDHRQTELAVELLRGRLRWLRELRNS
jgi:DNA-binding PadR family transcriptional regulator